jgi:Arf/Sar family protein
LKSLILSFQDLQGALDTEQLSQRLGLIELKDRVWSIQPSCAINGQGLDHGLDWLAIQLAKSKKKQKIDSDRIL